MRPTEIILAPINHLASDPKRQRRWYRTGLAVTAVALLAAGCGSGTGSSHSPAGSVKSGGTLTYALDEDVPGFNTLLEGDNEFVLT